MQDDSPNGHKCFMLPEVINKASLVTGKCMLVTPGNWAKLSL